MLTLKTKKEIKISKEINIEFNLKSEHKKDIGLFKKGRITAEELDEKTVVLALCFILKLEMNKDHYGSFKYACTFIQQLFNEKDFSTVRIRFKNISMFLRTERDGESINYKERYEYKHQSEIVYIRKYKNILEKKTTKELNEIISYIYINQSIPKLED